MSILDLLCCYFLYPFIPIIIPTDSPELLVHNRVMAGYVKTRPVWNFSDAVQIGVEFRPFSHKLVSEYLFHCNTGLCQSK